MTRKKIAVFFDVRRSCDEYDSMHRSNDLDIVRHLALRGFCFSMKITTLSWGLFLCLSACFAEEWNLQAPKDFQVIQRSHLKGGNLPVGGTAIWSESALGKLEIRHHGDVSAPWTLLGDVISGESFSFAYPMKSGGWYRIELRIVSDNQTVANLVIEHVGIGEVFIVSGQSNSANYGEERQETATKRVTTFHDGTWRLSKDPQPGASGGGGSFIPLLGDMLASHLDVPIGFVSCGIGATSVREWMPEGFRFPNPPTLTGRVKELPDGQWASDGRAYAMFVERMRVLGKRGFRAVLWHQGESDAHQKDPTRTLPGPLYRDYLKRLISSSRHDIGWDAPWFVAQVSYHVPGDEASPDIRAAQAALWKDGVALQGPDSDALKGALRENNGQGVHFSAEGLKEHARSWVDKILPWFETFGE